MTNGDEVKHIRLEDVFVDPNWNSRSIANVNAESSELGDREGTGITGLQTNIAQDGQENPVAVRSTTAPFYAKTSKPYALVTGFRRFEAITRINADKDLAKLRADEKKPSLIPNTANGTIRAFVLTLSESEARALNIRENTLRDDLTPPDLMRGIAELANKHKISQVEIGARIGKAQGYVGKLLAISTCDAKVLEHWRNGGEFEGVKSIKRVTTNDMLDISKIDKGRQAEEYLRVIQTKTASASEKDANQWVDAAKKRAETIGWMLGVMQRDGFLKLSGKVSWIDAIPLYLKLGKKELKARQERSVAASAEKAFEKALTAEEVSEEEEGDDDGEGDE